MRLKLIALLTLAVVVAFAPQAFAFGGGGAHSVSGTTADGTSFSGTCTGNQCSGTTMNPDGTFSGVFTQFPASEPLSMLLVGVGLVGARYLRRRQK